MEWIGILVGISFFLIFLIVLAKKSKVVNGKIKDVKPWDEYLYQAYVELEDDTTEEVILFSKHPLRKNFKFILERKGEKLFTVKKIY
jgi:hypothetical protein